ncbi:MAG: alpha/beta hydrolase [Bacteroidetes bacterium B1(2017)]|nr:MAG: alpha/beta hydrolase [Bacteroidetes bacterium B1(2017)]
MNEQPIPIYFLSGLGADSRAFKRVKFPVKYTVIHLPYFESGPTDTLERYAAKMAKEIDSSKPFYLVGLSFGGILCCELLRFIQPQKTFLISSIAAYAELPLLFKIGGSLRIHRLLPSKATTQSNWITRWYFGVKKQSDKLLLNDILKHTDTQFSKWAIHAIVTWKRKEPPTNIIRIHGSNDHLLPINGFKPKYLINKAGHFMVLTKAQEISEILIGEMEGNATD